MSRRIKQDSQTLICYFNSYSLEGIFSQDKAIQDCRQLHRKLFGLMVFVGDLKIQKMNELPSYVFEYLDEMVSDLMLSIFCWAQGAYKPAKLELRCAIEDFLKAMLSINNCNILEEKRIFQVFIEAQSDIHFNNQISHEILEGLRNYYSELCLIVHSSSNPDDPCNAIRLLPKVDPNISLKFVKLFSSVIELILSDLYLNYYELIQRMHPENLQDFQEALSKSWKTKITAFLFP